MCVLRPAQQSKASGEARSLDFVVCRLLGLPKFAIAEGIGSCNHNSTTNNVTQGDWDQILGQECVPGDVCIQVHGHGDDEHVGNGVLKTNGNEGGDGEVNANSFACQAVSSNGHPCCQAHKPVGQNGSQEGLQNNSKVKLIRSILNRPSVHRVCMATWVLLR